MRTRRAVVVGVVVLAALLLSGCTELGSWVNKVNIDVGLQKLTTQLEEISSVTTVTSAAKITPKYGYTVDVQVVVDELVEEDLLDIVATVTETFAKDAFAVAEELSFELSSVDGAQLWLSYPFTVPADELQDDIHYWIALSAVYPAALTMEVWPDSRAISAINDIAEEPDWAVLRAVPDDSDVSKQWNLGELSFSDEFPPDSVLQLRTALRDVAVGEDQVQLWEYHPGYIQVAFFPEEPGDVETPGDSSGWPQVPAAVQLILDSDVALATFIYYYENADDSNILPSTVHLGLCATEVYVSPGDDALWEALAASNLELPEGSGAGYCGYE